MDNVTLSTAFLLPPASETHVWSLKKSSLSCHCHLPTLFPQLYPLTKAIRSRPNGPSLLSVAPEPHPKAKGSAGYIPRRIMSVIPIYNILIIKMEAGLQHGLAGRTVAGSPGVHLEHKPGIGVHACNCRTWEVKVGELEVQVILGYLVSSRPT